MPETETLRVTRTGYRKIKATSGQVVHQKPDGKFCSERAYTESETKTTPEPRAIELGQEKDIELGRAPEAPVRKPKEYDLEDLENLEEKEGEDWIGKDWRSGSP